MERKDAIAEGESPEKWGEIGDWVQGQLREKLQLLAAPADDQLHHFPPHVAIVAEMIADYLHDFGKYSYLLDAFRGTDSSTCSLARCFTGAY